MKQYIKPSIDVVELSVKENLAALPVAVNGTKATNQTISGQNNVTLTTYNLAAATQS